MRASAAAIRKAGVPNEVLSTTLPKMGQQGIRAAIESGALYAEGALSVIVPSSNAPKQVDEAAFVFYLTAKEVLLAGKNIHIVHMVDLLAALSGVFVEENLQDFFRMLKDADVLMVDGVFGTGDAYFSAQAGQQTVAFLMSQSRKGKPMVFLSHSTQLTEWWPASFIGYVQRKADIFEVSA